MLGGSTSTSVKIEIDAVVRRVEKRVANYAT